MKRTVDMEKIVSLYWRGIGPQAIAEMVGCSRPTVQRILADANINPSGSRKNKIDSDELVKLYLSGLTVAKSAQKMKCSLSAAYAILRNPDLNPEGIRPDASKATQFKPKLTVEQSRKAKELYEGGLGLDKVGEELECSRAAVRTSILREGGEILPEGPRHKRLSPEKIQEIGELWESGVSQTSIAESLGIHQTTVSNILKDHGYGSHKRLSRGESSNKWKGGRVINGSGYIDIMLSPNDPFASMRKRSGYVGEHRYVMAQKLGRCLLENENVHHINGDITDNRIENLELWVTKQPKGQRPKDLLEFAYEIISTYEGQFGDKLNNSRS